MTAINQSKMTAIYQSKMTAMKMFMTIFGVSFLFFTTNAEDKPSCYLHVSGSHFSGLLAPYDHRIFREMVKSGGWGSHYIKPYKTGNHMALYNGTILYTSNKDGVEYDSYFKDAWSPKLNCMENSGTYIHNEEEEPTTFVYTDKNPRGHFAVGRIKTSKPYAATERYARTFAECFKRIKQNNIENVTGFTWHYTKKTCEYTQGTDFTHERGSPTTTHSIIFTDPKLMKLAESEMEKITVGRAGSLDGCKTMAVNYLFSNIKLVSFNANTNMCTLSRLGQPKELVDDWTYKLSEFREEVKNVPFSCTATCNITCTET